VTGTGPAPGVDPTVTATSSDQAIVPNANIALSRDESDWLVRVTPLPDKNGPVDITLLAGNGHSQTVKILHLTFTPVNDPPVAASDSYTVSGNQTLTVTPANGVLKNDADIDSPTLQAQVVGNPAHGTVTLGANGSFTYQPAAGFAGPDSFTYRASDGALASGVATVSIAVTPSQCAPRTTVKVSTQVVNGQLQATILSLPQDSPGSNSLHELRFGTFQNGTVAMNGQNVGSGQAVSLAAGTTRLQFTVSRATPGQPTTIPLTVVDDCGAWPSFVGGGVGAAF
jgi:VCBS repeat-containing protein